MDIEKLIEQLKRNTDCWTDKVHGYADLRLAAATALSTLQAENEKLRAELDEKEKYYDQMIDALAATDSAELEQVKRERRIIPKGYALVKLKLLEELDNFRSLGSIDRLHELAQADSLIGQTVYEPNKRGFISTYEVISIHISGGSVLAEWELLDGIYSNLNGFEISALGKTVFLTREEAEAALRREQDG